MISSILTPASIFTSPIIQKRRGPISKSKVKIKWSADFAYAIGLIVSDGNVSRNCRHISFASKDIEQIKNYLKALDIKNFIGTVNMGLKNQTYRTQFSDIYFWNFLSSIGVHPNKSKTIGRIAVPKEFVLDFVRGVFDGDGSFYSYIDTRWKGSLMFYISFASGSKDFIEWLQIKIYDQIGISGHITKPAGRNTVYQLRYAKQESCRLLDKMYEKEGGISLSRKRLKIKKILGTIATP